LTKHALVLVIDEWRGCSLAEHFETMLRSGIARPARLMIVEITAMGLFPDSGYFSSWFVFGPIVSNMLKIET
jgi:hypothetical protein